MSGPRLTAGELPAKFLGHANNRAILEAAMRKTPLRMEPAEVQPAKPRSPIRQERPLTKLEADFLAHMTALGHKLERETLSFRLANGSRYKPDWFERIDYGSYVRYNVWETKGYKRSKDAVLQKVVAGLYPWCAFHFVQHDNARGWVITPILP